MPNPAVYAARESCGQHSLYLRVVPQKNNRGLFRYRSMARCESSASQAGIRADDLCPRDRDDATRCPSQERKLGVSKPHRRNDPGYFERLLRGGDSRSFASQGEAIVEERPERCVFTIGNWRSADREIWTTPPEGDVGVFRSTRRRSRQ